ncbi:tyrosine-type recombinase/integrase [Salinibacillus xinjiangensis]|uniref:tyrosine-type recombinase/integrase n=1 Tax=Salinibacillus xinjiangensis TaxID=1229268 RepID=UPI002B26F144|nr:site-specific integrase [Salinibacillus xinjiangensis]
MRARLLDVSILFYTGIRIGELVALKWKDVDFINHTINITKTNYNPNTRRKIVWDEDVISILKKHKEIQDQVIKDIGDDYYNKDFIFAKMERQHGFPIVVKAIQNRMTRLLKISGLNPDLTPHSLRQTHTSLLAEAGVALEQIMDRLGHSDDQITKDVYFRLTQEMKKEASQKFAQLMRSLN